jgi:hypothetical protein
LHIPFTVLELFDEDFSCFFFNFYFIFELWDSNTFSSLWSGLPLCFLFVYRDF